MFYEEYDLYTAGERGYHECRIPALITTTKGTILAFNEARKNNGRDFDQIDLFLRRSFDNGKSFEDVQVVASLDGWVSGNPAPVQDRSTGTIWLPFCRNLKDPPGSPGGFNFIRQGKVQRTVWVTSSDDEGATWAEPRQITREVKLDNWTWYATGPGHSIQLESGRLLVPCNHSLKTDGTGRNDPDFCHVIYSDDHGASWKIGGTTDGGCNESSLLETADGWVYFNCRSQFPALDKAPTYRRVGWSNDGGLSFSPLVHDGGLPEPVCEGSVCRFTLGDTNRVLFSNPASSREWERLHLTVRLSYDECRTWPVKKSIWDFSASYSDLCIAKDGTICCLYEKHGPGGVSYYSGRITFARFDLEWLSDGKDRL